MEKNKYEKIVISIILIIQTIIFMIVGANKSYIHMVESEQNSYFLFPVQPHTLT